MPLFVMDSVSFARLPSINAEDVSYIAVASRIAETNARLDLMNSLISENTARCLQNEERVQYLARPKNNHASYSNVTGSDNSSQLHQASSNVSESRQSASKLRLSGLTDAPPSGPFKMPKPPSIAPLFLPGHIPLSSLLSKKSSSTSRGTQVDAGDPQSGTARTSDGAASSMCSGPQSDVSDVPEHVTSNSNADGHDDTNNHGPNSDQGAASIHGPTTPYGSSNNLHRVSSQVSLDAVGGHQNKEKWNRVSHNRPKANDLLRGSRRLHGTASSNKVSGTSDPHGYLFISRISRDTKDEDMLEWIENLDVNIIDFTRASHIEARSKSFVLTVNIREYHRLLNPDLCPANIQISRYIIPKAQREIVA